MSALLDGVTLHNFASVIDDTRFAKDLASFYGRHLFEGIQGLFGKRDDARDLTVLLLPGVLGTSLDEGPTRALWIDPIELAFDGGLERLRIAPGAAFNDDRSPYARDAILAGNPLVFLYGPLFAHLRSVRGFDVRQFGYDWRLSIDDAADRLAKEIRAHDKVAVVGHSMGCLVTRRCVQRHPELIDRIAQAVFMGPPMGGSFVPAQVAVEDYWASVLVEDIVGRERIAKLLVTCPGFAEMLPDDAVFSGARGRLAKTGSLERFPSVLLDRSQTFAEALRQPQGEARDADLALSGRTSIVLTTTRATVVDVADTNGAHSFLWETRGDDTVPTLSAWDPNARGHYLSSFSHPIIPLEPAVILALGELLLSGGASAPSLVRCDTIPEALSHSGGFFAPGPVARRDPGARDRLATDRYTLADLLPPWSPREPVANVAREAGFVAPTLRADDVIANLERALAASNDRWRIERRPDLRMCEGVTVAPDLAAWRSDATGASVPAWCCQVLTAANSLDVRRFHLPLYARAGVERVWLVDAERRSIEVFGSRGGAPVLLETVGDDPAWQGEPFDVAVGQWRDV